MSVDSAAAKNLVLIMPFGQVNFINWRNIRTHISVYGFFTSASVCEENSLLSQVLHQKPNLQFETKKGSSHIKNQTISA